MPRFQFNCVTCKSFWHSFSPDPSASKLCRNCGILVFGQAIQQVPPAPPSSSSATNPASSAQRPSRRWETIPKQTPTGLFALPKKATEFYNVQIPLPESETTVIEQKPKEPEVKVESPVIEAAPESPKKKEYVPAAERPENKIPRPKFYRFFALNTNGGPGLAGAMAESREEAMERIVVRFLENLAIHSNRNQKINQFTARYPLLLQARSPEDLTTILASYGLTYEQYQQQIGPTPMDSLGGWNAHMQNHSAVTSGQAGQLLANQLKEELSKATWIEYPDTNCAFYMGGPM